jgi:A/G-specific adenine glycosylase
MSHRLAARFGHRTLVSSRVKLFQRRLLRWWSVSKRRFPWRVTRASGYHHIVSEVLLQRTRAETVARFWPMFIARFPTWRALSDATISEIEVVLRPIGLSRQRAPRMWALAAEMTARRGRFPNERESLESLPGVGQYVANAVFTLRHGKPEPLLDTNMARVLERFFGPRKLADIRYDPYLQELARELVRHKEGKAINWAILDFAALVCIVGRPRCEICPLTTTCVYFRNARSVSRA